MKIFCKLQNGNSGVLRLVNVRKLVFGGSAIIDHESVIEFIKTEIPIRDKIIKIKNDNLFKSEQ